MPELAVKDGRLHSDGYAQCPGCASRTTLCVGPLPDVHWFAGKRLSKPIPGGFLHRCEACALAFRHPRLETEDYASMYDRPEPAAWSGENSRTDWSLLAESAFKAQTNTRRLLDFGCHTGGLLARFGAIPELYGVEVNASAADVASRMTGASVYPSLTALPAGLTFDLITACDVVEHVADPASLIRSLVERLSENGRLLISTGDSDTPAWRGSGANWWYCFYPEHIAFISRRWLEIREANGDFKLLECRNFRLGELGWARRVWDRVLMAIYSRHPRFLLQLSHLVRILLRNGPPASVPGNGVVRDHLLIVLGKPPQASTPTS